MSTLPLGPSLIDVDLSRVETIHALRSVFGSDGPSTAALAALAEHTQGVRIPAGTNLTRDGSFGGLVYILTDGATRLSRAGRSWGTFHAPGAVGVLGALAPDERGFECEALVDTTALVTDAEGLLEVLEDHPELMLGMMRGFASGAIALRRKLPHAGFVHEPLHGEVWPIEPLDLVERIIHLRSTFGFGNTFITELAELARAARERRYTPGTRLWAAGDRADHAVVVLCGSLDCISVDGATFRCGAGDILGNLDAMAQIPRWFEATVVDSVVALELHRESMLDVLEDQPALGFTFMRMITMLLADLRERLHAQVAETSPSTTA